MSRSSYFTAGLGCFGLPINWFDQFVPTDRQRDLQSLIRDVPIPTVQVLQHLLEPALQAREALATQAPPVFANIIATLDRSQCPLPKHKHLINDLPTEQLGPTWHAWEWRRRELEKAVDKIANENINLACTILNGTKAISLHSHRLEDRIDFKTTSHITQSFLMVLRQGGKVQLGKTLLEEALYAPVFTAVQAEYPLATLYDSINAYLNSALSPVRPVLTFSDVLHELAIVDINSLTQAQLLQRARLLTIYLPSASDAAFVPVTTEALKTALLDGSLSGVEFAKYLIAAGYDKTAILGLCTACAMLRSKDWTGKRSETG
ncbi:hypothetical protein JCM10296v2_000705 [Rhodotorula toruloides]